MRTIDLNADIGEGHPDDFALIEHATSVNIACGGHAGDDASMRMSIEASKAAGISIGAHPGYEDRENFGRVELDLSPQELTDQLTRQLERFLSIYPALHHVKPHGALYNRANIDASVADITVRVIAELQPKSLLYCPPYGELIKAANKVGLHTVQEGFIDRAYLGCGNLTPRKLNGAIIDNFNEAASQAMQMVTTHSVVAIDGSQIAMPVQTICVHGDNQNALCLISFIRDLLNKAGVEIKSA